MIDLLTNIDEYLASHLNISKEEFQNLLNHDINNISGPSDIKVAISHAMKANRFLSKVKCRLKTMLSDKNEVYDSKVDDIKENIYKHKRELNLGLHPLCDKEWLDANYQERLTLWETEKAALEKEIEDAASQPVEKKPGRPAKLPSIEDFIKRNPKPVAPRYTSADISEYTNNDIKSATETVIKEIASRYAKRTIDGDMIDLNKALQIVGSLESAIHEELRSLGNLSYVIGSEQYGLNKQQSLEKKENSNW